MQDASLPEKEITAQVQTFLGYTLGMFLNDIITTRNDVPGNCDFSIEEHLIESMTVPREEYLKPILIREEKSLSHFTKSVHLRFSKIES